MCPLGIVSKRRTENGWFLCLWIVLPLAGRGFTFGTAILFFEYRTAGGGT